MANRVIHFEIQADDITRAKEFYEKTFGWKVKQMMTKEKGGIDYWGVTTGPEGTPGINGGLYMRPPESVRFSFDCTLEVDDIDSAIALVIENGGSIRREKMEIEGVGWYAGAMDTEKNVFGIMQATNPDLLK